MFSNRKVSDRLTAIESECRKLSAANVELEKKIKNLEEKIALQNNIIDTLKQRKKEEQPQPVSSGIKLTEEQQNVLTRIKTTNDNFFITGKAGTGKSTLLKELVKISDPKHVAVVAYTGTAALNVKGQTIHSFFHLSIEPQNILDPESINMPYYVSEVLAAINMLIIDELSMVRSDILDMIDKKMQKARKSSKPFGGCRIIAFGDLYQLAPIAKTREEKEFICSRYKTLYFFGAPASQTFKIIELQNVMRQADKKFISVLNEVRLGHVTSEILTYINNNSLQTTPDNWMHLTLKRDVANTINAKMLGAIQGEETVYKTTFGGEKPPTDDDVAFDYILRLKVGARVIAVMNDVAKRYVNGSIGIVTELKTDSVVVNFNGVDVPVEPATCEKRKYVYDRKTHSLSCEITGWAKQLPLKLAYAVTVHKAQGQTYDNVILDFAGCNTFSAGQMYVALSRCKSMSGVRLTRPILAADIFANKEVTAYLNGYFTPNIIENKTKKETKPDYDSLELPF